MQRFQEWCRRNIGIIPTTLCLTGILAGFNHGQLFAQNCTSLGAYGANCWLGVSCSPGGSYIGSCSIMWVSVSPCTAGSNVGSFDCISGNCSVPGYVDCSPA